MTDEEMNKAIAEACGWKCGYTEKSGYYVVDPNGFQRGWSKLEDVAISALPNYCADLNAMHEAEKVLGEKRIRTYAFLLAQVLDTSPTVDLDDQFLNIHATARQRAEAFLRTLGKWEEGQG